MRLVQNRCVYSRQETMTIQAIVFDIGGVLEITPDLCVTAKWERRLDLSAGELDRRLLDVWKGGSRGSRLPEWGRLLARSPRPRRWIYEL